MPVNVPQSSVDTTKPLDPQAPVTPPAGGGNPPAPTPENNGGNKGGKKPTVDLREQLVNKAREEGKFSDEQIAEFGSMSNTLSFVRSIGLDSEKSTYAVRGQSQAESCAEVVGAIFVSTEPIKVPRLDMAFTTATGFTAADIQWVDVAANEEFDVSMLEAAVLLVQPQYSSRFMFNGEPRGQFAAKFPALNKGAKLPTPHFLITDYQYKAYSEVIDVKGADGNYTIKPEFERYAALLNKPKAQRGGGKTTGTTLRNSDKTSIAFRQLIGL